MTKHQILFLAANPKRTDRLELPEEARAIENALERAGHRDAFELKTKWAVEPLDVLDGLQKHKPTILHISSHGERSGPRGGGFQAPATGAARYTLLLHGPDGTTHEVSGKAIADAIAAAGTSVRLVLLNACFSDDLADSLVSQVDCVIGMAGAIRDVASRGFAIGFYGGIANGASVAEAFEAGRAAIPLMGLVASDQPRVRARDGVDLAQMVLARHPSVPPSSVPLPEKHAAGAVIVNRLVLEAKLRDEVLHGAAWSAQLGGRTALRGGGGAGKSTMLSRLSRDPAIVPGRYQCVLAVELGEGCDVLRVILGWLRAVGVSTTVATIDDASEELRRVLAERSALIVVDNVWTREHVEPFLVGGPQCYHVFATRLADIADLAGPNHLDLVSMTELEVLDLFERRLGRPLGSDREAALRVANAVSRMPLALAHVANRAARNVTWAFLEAELGQEVARLEALQGTLDVNPVEASIAISLRHLASTSERAWRSLLMLSILQGGTRLAAPFVTTFLDITDRDADRMLEQAWNETLLQDDAVVELGGREWRTYRFHDVVRHVCRGALERDLKMSMRDAHRAWVDAHRKKLAGSWSTLPDDGYAHAYLMWHFNQAGLGEEIHRLLIETDDSGRNAWQRAREAGGDDLGYVSDVMQAYRLAGENLALQVRYAAITSTQMTKSARIPEELLLAFASKGLWSTERIIAHVHRIEDEVRRSSAFSDLARRHAEPYRTELVRWGLQMVAELSCKKLHRQAAYLLGNVIVHLNADECDDAERALAAAESTGELEGADDLRAGLLRQLCVKGRVAEAIERAHANGPAKRKARALEAISPHLRGAEVDRAIGVTRAMAIDDWESALAAMPAALARDNRVDEGLALVEQLTHGRRSALLGISPHLVREADRKRALELAAPLDLYQLTLVRIELWKHDAPELAAAEIQVHYEKCYRACTSAGDSACVQLIPILPESLLDQELEFAKDEFKNAAAIRYAKGGRVDKALALVEGDELALLKIAPWLAGYYVARIIDERVAADPEAYRCGYLLARAAELRLGTSWKPRELERRLTPSGCENALAQIAKYLDVEDLRDAYASLDRPDDGGAEDVLGLICAAFDWAELESTAHAILAKPFDHEQFELIAAAASTADVRWSRTVVRELASEPSLPSLYDRLNYAYARTMCIAQLAASMDEVDRDVAARLAVQGDIGWRPVRLLLRLAALVDASVALEIKDAIESTARAWEEVAPRAAALHWLGFTEEAWELASRDKNVIDAPVRLIDGSCPPVRRNTVFDYVRTHTNAYSVVIGTLRWGPDIPKDVATALYVRAIECDIPHIVTECVELSQALIEHGESALALDLALRIPSDREKERSEALAIVAPSAGKEQAFTLLEEALALAHRATQRHLALSKVAIAAIRCELAPTAMRILVERAVATLARTKRRDFLLGLAAIMPLFVRAGGSAVGAWREVERVRSWS